MPEKSVTRRRFGLLLTLLGFAAAFVVLLLQWHYGSGQYYLTAVVITLLAFLPFAVSFEKHRPSAREMTVLAVMIALAVAARAAFYALPSVKPMGAIVIVTAICLGPQSGFLTGAAAMLLSNFIFGQGPWTPFQMLGMGAVGLAAGLVFRIPLLRQNRLLLALTGGVLILLFFCTVVDISTVLLYSAELTLATVRAVYLTAVPLNLIHAGTVALALLAAGPALMRKLERVKTKYGLFQ